MDWFYHAPGQGRVGPLSADDLRTRYRDRRIERDTLVWREGMPEWQPLERVADQIDLASVVQDTRLPPPLPPVLPAAMTPVAAPAHAHNARPGYRSAAPMPAPRRMHGCVIALLIGAGLSIPLLGILAAIALPAYQQYTVRAKLASQIEGRAMLLREGTLRARQALGRCPADAGEAGVMDPAAAEGLTVGTVQDGRCAFEITVRGVDPEVDGRTLLYVAPANADSRWDCTGGDLPAPYRPAACRDTPNGTTP